MAYGTPRAVTSTYWDTVLCMSCANVVYRTAKTQQIAPDDFWVFLRDLDIEQARMTLYGGDEQQVAPDEWDLAQEIARGEWIDPQNRDKLDPGKLGLFCEGYYPDQEEMADTFCEKCLVLLQDLCTDYP